MCFEDYKTLLSSANVVSFSDGLLRGFFSAELKLVIHGKLERNFMTHGEMAFRNTTTWSSIFNKKNVILQPVKLNV